MVPEVGGSNALAHPIQLVDRWLIVEFVPKSDSQAQRRLATREDVFPDHDFEGFERSFAEHFVQRRRIPIPDTERVLYHFDRR